MYALFKEIYMTKIELVLKDGIGFCCISKISVHLAYYWVALKLLNARRLIHLDFKGADIVTANIVDDADQYNEKQRF